MNRLALALKWFQNAPWQLWASQLNAVVRIELRKSLWMRRSIWVYLVAFAPVAVITLHALNNPMGRDCTIQGDTNAMALIFQFYLHGAIFFACMGLFTWLFRGEIVEKSLHYYFLAPMRRELLVLGKFFGGLLALALTFSVSVLLAFAIMYGHFGQPGRAYVFDGPGLSQLFAYLGVTVLACVGYGSVFLALSLVFRNPILPGAAVFLWETFHAIMPPLLQKLSVIFYLKQLSPVTIPADGVMALFTVVAEPVSAWIAVPGLLCLCTVILIFACLRIRRTEISYLAD